MQSISPVWSEAEVELELVLALDQPEYCPIVVLPIRYGDGTQGMVVRFRFTEVDRQRIADGADLLITELTFGQPFTPLSVDLMMPGEKPE